MASSAGIHDVGPIIQLAVAPVFLLNAVGALMGVHITRLARAVDRTRILQDRSAAAAGQASGPIATSWKSCGAGCGSFICRSRCR